MYGEWTGLLKARAWNPWTFFPLSSSFVTCDAPSRFLLFSIADSGTINKWQATLFTLLLLFLVGVRCRKNTCKADLRRTGKFSDEESANESSAVYLGSLSECLCCGLVRIDVVWEVPNRLPFKLARSWHTDHNLCRCWSHERRIFFVYGNFFRLYQSLFF